jgi:ketosteroid isomerase-like protein
MGTLRERICASRILPRKLMRRPILAFCLSCATTMAVADTAAPKDASKPQSVLRLSSDECAVWNRERSFAASVEHHDAKAFAEHLHENAVFVSGEASTTRGRPAIANDWASIIQGKDVELHWFPQIVVIGGSAARNVASSAGNYWYEDKSPDARQRFLIGRFTSVWIKDRDGQWRVLYDGGGASPRPGSEADVAKLRASFVGECPRGS